MLAEIVRHSCFTAEVDVPGLHRRIRSMIEDAESFIAKLPSDAVGVIFMGGDKAVQPDVDALDKYQRNPGAPGGVWPSSPEISATMLERYNNTPKPSSSINTKCGVIAAFGGSEAMRASANRHAVDP